MESPCRHAVEPSLGPFKSKTPVEAGTVLRREERDRRLVRDVILHEIHHLVD